MQVNSMPGATFCPVGLLLVTVKCEDFFKVILT